MNDSMEIAIRNSTSRRRSRKGGRAFKTWRPRSSVGLCREAAAGGWTRIWREDGSRNAVAVEVGGGDQGMKRAAVSGAEQGDR